MRWKCTSNIRDSRDAVFVPRLLQDDFKLSDIFHNEILCIRARKYCFQLTGNAATCRARRTEFTTSSPYLFAMYRRVISETATPLVPRVNHFHVVTDSNFSIVRDREIKACPTARKESFHHVGGLKPHAQFVARKLSLRHDYLRRADRLYRRFGWTLWVDPRSDSS